MPGRRPKPSHLKVVTGNPGRRPLNKDEPKPCRELPSPPDHLSDAARVAWGRLSVLLDRMGVLTEADVVALERAAECYAEILRYREIIDEESEVYWADSSTGGRLLKANPAVAMLADADRRLKGYLVEFGLTPAARTKVKKNDPDGEEDPAAKYFG